MGLKSFKLSGKVPQNNFKGLVQRKNISASSGDGLKPEGMEAPVVWRAFALLGSCLQAALSLTSSGKSFIFLVLTSSKSYGVLCDPGHRSERTNSESKLTGEKRRFEILSICKNTQ